MNFLELLEYKERQNQFIKLISIPKTGSSAINFILQDRIENLVTLKENEVNLCTPSRNVINIITIRNPLERFISYYSHWKYGNTSSSIFEDKSSENSEKNIFTLIDKIKRESKIKSPAIWNINYRPQSFWLNKLYRNTVAIIYRNDWNEIIDDLNAFFYIKKQTLIQDIPFLNQSICKEKFSEEEMKKIEEFVKDFYQSDYQMFDNLKLFKKVI